MIILKSLLITGTLSALIGFGLRNIIGFWEGFALAFALQFIIAYIYSSFKITNEMSIADSYEEQIDSLLDMSRVSIMCPCGKKTFEDSIFVGIDNMFECDVCGSTFKAEITVTPTLVTDIIDVNKTFDDLVKEKEL